MSEHLNQLGSLIRAKRSDCVSDFQIRHGELTIMAVRPSIVDFLEFLKSDPECRFTLLVDITAVDWPERPKRFDVVYHLLSMHHNQRLRLRVPLREGESMPSATAVHPAADWYERETFDMFGIFFTNHPDLRRLLTDYGFSGHPLRKDFPTTGYTEVRYDDALKRVVYEPVSLVQEYRQFDFMSPWEGADYILPKADKKDTPKEQG
ncbi:MAG: NADH-quinone oxidoreductase subunit C [Rhodobacteraceae bacterium]|nr:NADH-quinone oxidoreductase subunit C [Paracoccaceae bacterium]